MVTLALRRHAGVSFVGGSGVVHFRAANVDSRDLRSAWNRLIAENGLGAPLRIRAIRGGALEGWARAYIYLPLDTASAALCAACEGRTIAPSLLDALALHGADARMYDASYGLHVRAAARRGWVVTPLRLGFMPALLLGAGRHAHLLMMNLTAKVSGALALAGSNKAIARDLLTSHGLPVAPGALATSAAMAVDVARRLGGAVVIKRMVGGNSDGVIVGLTSPRDIRSAAHALLTGSHAVLVESFVEGTELRLHFIAGRLHRAFRAEPFTVTGDGRRSLAALLRARYPRYLRTMSASNVHRRRLVLCLWGIGVRSFTDLERVIPSRGRVVRVSAASGTEMERVKASDFIRAGDIARIERFLAGHGAPSCGLDVVIHTPRAPLAQAGVILELNAPCGFAYLDRPHDAVVADLNAAIEGDPTFRRDLGRVPVWFIMDELGTRAAERAAAALRRRYPALATGRLDPASSSWVALLNEPAADALLVTVSEAAVLAHGIPANLAPVLLRVGDKREFVSRFPITYRTVQNGKGRLGVLPRASIGV